MSRRVVTLGLSPAPEPEDRPRDDGDAGPISLPGPPRRSGRSGMAASAVLHTVVVLLVLQAAIVRAPSAVERPLVATPRAEAVFLPPPAALRRILNLPPLPAPRHPSTPKDRISIGPPAPMRSKEPLEFHRNDDLMAVAKGTPEASEAPRLVQSAPPPPPTRAAGASLGEGGRLTPLIVPQGAPGPILASLQRLASATGGDPGPVGIPTGRGGQMGPLAFDPQGADFTAWVQRFVNEVYRNWIVPPSASLGWAGQVDFEFVVDRSGTMTSVTLLESSGTGAYDRAAKNALVASRLLPLPADYAPTSCTMKVGFIYNPPRGGGRGGR